MHFADMSLSGLWNDVFPVWFLSPYVSNLIGYIHRRWAPFFPRLAWQIPAFFHHWWPRFNRYLEFARNWAIYALIVVVNRTSNRGQSEAAQLVRKSYLHSNMRVRIQIQAGEKLFLSTRYLENDVTKKTWKEIRGLFSTCFFERRRRSFGNSSTALSGFITERQIRRTHTQILASWFFPEKKTKFFL